MSDGLQVRVEQLERDLAQMREEWAVVQQAPLIQARLLNALRETQVEHGEKLADHDQAFVRLEAGQRQIIEMLGRLIGDS